LRGALSEVTYFIAAAVTNFVVLQRSPYGLYRTNLHFTAMSDDSPWLRVLAPVGAPAVDAQIIRDDDEMTS
jgi:hypothetical protein